MKNPSDFDSDDVAICLMALGLESKIPAFRENGVDGRMLLALTTDDLTNDLGLTNLQAKKLHTRLEWAKEVYAHHKGEGNEVAESNAAIAHQLADMSDEVASLKSALQAAQDDNVALRKELDGLKTPPSKPAHTQPVPQAQAAPPQQSKANDAGRDMVRGGARGAVGGVIMGAAVGAAAGNARKGAKIGAAAGGTRGALRGIGRHI
jgi:regulator of replication initiation timing